MINVYKRDSWTDGKTLFVGFADPVVVPFLVEFSFPSVANFVQSDKGVACLVISGIGNSYQVEIDCFGNEKKHPIPIAEFVQEKDAIIFISIWNKSVEMKAKESQQTIAG